MLTLLKRNDLSATDEALALRPSLEAAVAGTMAADLSEAVDNLDFATAEGLVADIVETLADDEDAA